MKFVIVTGMSGAGKSTALKVLEDLGYFCVDNLPIKLVRDFAELTFNATNKISKVAIGVDIRIGKSLSQINEVLEVMRQKGYNYEILFLDAADSTLVKRYKETRRNHPLGKNDGVDAGITNEREKLVFLRKQSDYIIDTTKLLVRELRQEIQEIFENDKTFENMFITISSFGFKNGILADADLVFDVRFMPNPYYVEELSQKTGNDSEVREFVMDSKASKEFMKKLYDMVDFLIENYKKEGKNQLVIAIGCTGGKHRSVTVANYLYEHLSINKSYGLRIEHRDIDNQNHGIKYK